VQVQVRPPVGYLSQWSPILCGIGTPSPNASNARIAHSAARVGRRARPIRGREIQTVI
jgi:hypothetical protein